jgi:hypothetical protein
LFTVEEVPSVKRVVARLDKTARQRYEDVKRELERSGCSAAGKRLRGAQSDASARVCSRAFYRQWRMHTLFGEDDCIYITFVGQHSDDENIHLVAASVLPEIAEIGRRAKDQPKCCDEIDDSLIPDEELVEILAALT